MNTPTPLALPSAAAFVKTSQTALPALTPAPSGHTPRPIPVVLPSAGGFSGNVSLPASAIAANTQLLVQLQNTAPTGIPTLSFLRRAAAAHPLDAAVTTPILYMSLAFSGGVTLANQPSMTFTLPSGDVVPNAYYYVALYDPTRPNLGWIDGFEGPGTVSGQNVTFNGGSRSFSFVPFMNYWFGLYAQSAQAPTPPPAPPATPTPAPTATPTPVVVNGIALNGAGQTYNATPSGDGPFVAFSSNTSVATVSSGSTVTITAVAAGTATITIGGPSSQTTVNVTVTTTTIPVQ